MVASQPSYAQRQTATVLAGQGQALIDLTPKDTQELLSQAANEVLHASAAQADAICARVAKLNRDSHLTSKFQRKQDALSALNLRVILPRSSEPDSATPPKITSFIAVSYCWHQPKDCWTLAPFATPIAPGWEISRPMMDVVMGQVRRVPDERGGLEGVWLDKLCINQADNDEKEHQVGAMDIVYRSARRVVILLEDVQLSVKEEAAGLAYAQFYEDMGRAANTGELQGATRDQFILGYLPQREQELRKQGRVHIIEEAKDFACKVLRARWLSRAWCAHESRMARHLKVNNPLFLCFGHAGRVLAFEFRCVHYIARHLHNWGPGNIPGTGNIDTPDPATLQQLWYRMQRLMPDVDPDVSAMQHLVSVLSSGCRDQQDLISIALNTARLPIVFNSGGENIAKEDLVWIFAMLVLAAGDVAPLVMTESSLQIINKAKRRMISWAVKPAQSVLGNREELTLPESITEVTREYIELDLLVFDASPTPPSPSAIHTAEEIINHHRLHELAREFMATDDITLSAIEHAVENIRELGDDDVANRSGPGPFDDSLKLWLALAIDCGLDWIKRFPGAMMDDTRDRWTYGTMGEIADPILTDTARSVLAHFGAGAVDSQTLEAVMRFMTCLLDNRLILFTIFPQRIIVGLGLGGSAITTFAGDKARIAVPAAVAHLPGWHKRAWVIEPFIPSPLLSSLPSSSSELEKHDPKKDADCKDSQRDWQLKTRNVIFGCPRWDSRNLPVGNSEGVVLLKRQRVYGG